MAEYHCGPSSTSVCKIWQQAGYNQSSFVMTPIKFANQWPVFFILVALPWVATLPNSQITIKTTVTISRLSWKAFGNSIVFNNSMQLLHNTTMCISMVESNCKIVLHCSTFWSWRWSFDFRSLQLLHRMNNLTMFKVHVAAYYQHYHQVRRSFTQVTKHLWTQDMKYFTAGLCKA